MTERIQRDTAFKEAVLHAVEAKKLNLSSLRARLGGIGAERAKTILEQLQSAGVIEPHHEADTWRTVMTAKDAQGLVAQ